MSQIVIKIFISFLVGTIVAMVMLYHDMRGRYQNEDGVLEVPRKFWFALVVISTLFSILVSAGLSYLVLFEILGFMR